MTNADPDYVESEIHWTNDQFLAPIQTLHLHGEITEASIHTVCSYSSFTTLPKAQVGKTLAAKSGQDEVSQEGQENVWSMALEAVSIPE